MTTLNIYLYFEGNCEQAFNFYKSIFGGDFQYVGRYKDMPKMGRENYPHCTDEQIMHITLPISKETLLMGADIMNIADKKIEMANNFSLILNTDSQTKADRLFNALSLEGKIELPIAEQFWGSYYGICFDKFGIKWKISCALNSIIETPYLKVCLNFNELKM